jgi:hypothetical protein
MMNQEIAEALVKWQDEAGAEFFEEVTSEKIVDKTRWSTYYIQVYRDTRDDTYWEIGWHRGSTEMQDEGPEDVTFLHVVPTQVLVTNYIPVKVD